MLAWINRWLYERRKAKLLKKNPHLAYLIAIEEAFGEEN